MHHTKQSASVFLSIAIGAAIALSLILSAQVRRTDTAVQQTRAAGCAMQVVIAPPATALPVTPTPTITPSPTPLARFMTFVARFEGVSKDVGPITARYMDDAGVLMNLRFEYNSGVYKALLSIGDQVLPPTFSFQVKPEKHLQRVFRSQATSALDFDLTGTPFEPGDLSPQDGVVDVNDISSVVSILAKSTQSSNDSMVADVNYDGVVNAADVGAILTTLSTHPDESL